MKVRLEVPLRENEELLSRRLFLKVSTNGTSEVFQDKECKKPISDHFFKMKNLDVEIPDEISLIAVATPCNYEVCQEIADAWFALFHVINQFDGLKKILIIGEDIFHEIEVINGSPDVKKWLTNQENDWWKKTIWALVAYIYGDATKSFGIFRWNSDLK